MPILQVEQISQQGDPKDKDLGIRRIRRCKDCGRKFTPRNQKRDPSQAGPQPR